MSWTGFSLKPVREAPSQAWTLIIPMNTGFAVEWKSFTIGERRKLKRLWSRYQFPADFCSRFAANVYRGAPGEPGGIWVYANGPKVFREHWSAELGFSTLEDLVQMASTVVLHASNSLWYCDKCGKPVALGEQCGWCTETGLVH
jgi:hypothetical protein